LAGVLQPSYEPRALSPIALSRWYGFWNKPQWDPRATLDFFTTENTVSWDSIEDVYKKTVVKGEETVQITVPGRGKRPIAFATAPTSQQSSEAEVKKSGPLDEEVTGNWEQGSTAARQQERRLNWIDTLSAVDLGRPEDDRKSRDGRHSWDDKRSRNRRYGEDRRPTRTPRPQYVKMTGSNQAELSRTRLWGGQSATSLAAVSSPPSRSEQDLSKEGWMAGSEAHAERRNRSWGSTNPPGTPSRDRATRPSRSSRD
jgi:hypothetical protein